MVLWGHAGRWSLFILAAVISGVRLQTDGASVRPASEAHIHQSVTLQRSEAAPPIGTYTVKNPAGKPCIKATVGVQYIVMQKTMTLYSNLDPFRVSTTGYCSDEAAVLSLTLPHNTTSLQLTFRKENNLVYVTELNAHVSPLPTCQGCPNKTYSGLLANEKLFAAASGQSFKCKSENLLLTSQSGLWIKLVPLQLQAFTLPTGQYGEEVECWADYNKRVIPIILGATVVGVILIALVTFLLIRDRRREGYTQL